MTLTGCLLSCPPDPEGNSEAVFNSLWTEDGRALLPHAPQWVSVECFNWTHPTANDRGDHFIRMSFGWQLELSQVQASFIALHKQAHTPHHSSQSHKPSSSHPHTPSLHTPPITITPSHSTHLPSPSHPHILHTSHHPHTLHTSHHPHPLTPHTSHHHHTLTFYTPPITLTPSHPTHLSPSTLIPHTSHPGGSMSTSPRGPTD